MRSVVGLAEPSWCHGLFVARWRLMPASVFACVSALVFTLAMMLGTYPFTETIDWVLHGEPNFHFLRTSLLGGEFPWWNPHVGLGRPYASDLQSAVCYPPTYLLMLGKFAGPSLFLGLHAFLAILGLHLLCRQLGGRGVFGLLGGCALLASMGFGGRLLVGHTFYFAGLCYLPLMLVALVKLRLRPTGRRIGALSILLALQFLTGHPQVFWNTVFGLGLFLTGLLFRPAPEVAWQRLPRLIAGLAGALLLSAGISAIAWLPFLDLIAEGNRQAPTLEFASFGCFGWEQAFGIVTDPPMSRIDWEHNYRLGFAWTVPGLVGLAMLRSTAMRALLFMGALAFWFSFGEQSGLFRACFELLPGASSFRVPARINVLPVLALTSAAAVFLSRPRPLPGVPWTGLATVGLLMAGLQAAYPFEGPPARIGMAEPVLALLLAAGTVYVWQRRSGWSSAMPPAALLLWLGLQIVELSGAHGRYGWLYSRKSVAGFTHEFPVVGQLREKQSSSPTDTPLRVMVPRILVPPNFGMRDGWTHVDSYTALFLRRPWDFLHSAAGVEPPALLNASLSQVFYWQPPFFTPNLSLNLALDPGTGGILVNANPVPRLWITFQPRLVGRPEEALAAVTNRLDLPREGIIESALPFPALATDETSGSASILRFRHSEIDVKCQLSHPGILVLNEAWFPGWHTVVAGRRIESQPVNYWMRGFALPAGEHTLKLKFRPRRLAEAIALSILSLGIGLALVFRGRRFWRRPAACAQ
ncbi:MAG: hypothetical protein HZA92_04930 [Verrucomicrobia bacterium]|nr:hypothetical protein [Verrucomicrobiota bacterium]